MFDFLQRREVLDIILSSKVVFSAVFTLALFIVVHSVLMFMRQSGELYTRLAQIDADLNVLHASIPGKLERITQLRRDLEPLQADFRQIQAYLFAVAASGKKVDGARGGSCSVRKKRRRTNVFSTRSSDWIGSSSAAGKQTREGFGHLSR